MIQVSIAKQEVNFLQEDQVIFSAPVSTATNGQGFTEGSYQTPTGKLRVREKIGEGAPLFTSFKGRLPRAIWNGEAASDAILTRILWLEGLDDENANTYQRYIYFHGTHAEDLIGRPSSHGCIRLKNEAMLRLFDLSSIFTPVEINE
ncbi:MAG: L,D-transpeptidase [Akkermansiaceae bacterium]